MPEEQLNALPRDCEFDGYRFDGVLGAGGFGITYRALELSIKRTVAIKEYLPSGVAMRGRDGLEIHPMSGSDRQDYELGLGWFRTEAESLVTFRHPNIVTVHRFFEANGTAYMVMEYEEGVNFGALLNRHRRLGEQAIGRILLPLLDGLEQVHDAGFLHRDLKPANIYIRSEGAPMLLDFGSARQALGQKSRRITAIVSSGYAPFEQYTSRGEQGPWTDIYAMGATFYHAIAGEPPPDATDRMMDDPMTPAVEAGRGRFASALLGAVDRALALLPEDRPQDMAEFKELLAGAGGARPARRARGPVEEGRRGSVVATLVVAVALMFGVVAGLWLSGVEPFRY